METEVSAKISNAQVSLFRWGLQNPVETVGIFLVILLTVTVFSQVFFRYALQIPLAWSEELAMFLFQWLSFIGAAIAVRQSFHYGLDLLTKRLSPRPKTITQIFSSVLIFYISFLMIVKGYGMMQITRMQIYPVLQFSVSYAYLAILIGGILMIYYQIPIFWKQIGVFRRK